MALATGLAQLAISVADLDRGKAFYGGALGLAHLFDAPPAMAFFQCGETRLMLAASPDAAKAGAIVYFTVDDVAEAHRQLVAGGAASESAPHFVARVEGRDLWLAFVRDADDHLVGLMSEHPAAD